MASSLSYTRCQDCGVELLLNASGCPVCNRAPTINDLKHLLGLLVGINRCVIVERVPGGGHRVRRVTKDKAPEWSSMWTVYILRCCDLSLYCGIAKDMDKRLHMHRKGKASKYTRSRLPVTIVYRELQPSKSEALRRECQIKWMSKKDKERLVAQSILDP